METTANQVLTEGTTRERLLDAAERLFAQRGFGDTSVRDITQVAGCNLASVNYHFGSKQKLYVAVLQRILAGLREYRISGLEVAVRKPDVELESILSTFARVFLEPLVAGGRGRRTLQLFLWEMLESHLPEGMVYSELVNPIYQAFSKALKMQCPELSEASLRLCTHSLVGQLSHVLQVTKMYTEMYTDARESGTPLFDMSKAVDHIVEFTAAGIRQCVARDREASGKEGGR